MVALKIPIVVRQIGKRICSENGIIMMRYFLEIEICNHSEVLMQILGIIQESGVKVHLFHGEIFEGQEHFGIVKLKVEADNWKMARVSHNLELQKDVRLFRLKPENEWVNCFKNYGRG